MLLQHLLMIDTDYEISLFSGHYHVVDEAVEANIRQYARSGIRIIFLDVCANLNKRSQRSPRPANMLFAHD